MADIIIGVVIGLVLGIVVGYLINRFLLNTTIEMIETAKVKADIISNRPS